MSRPLRIEYPNAWYHVMNRAAGKLFIFQEAEHFQLFFKSISEAHERFACEIHAYCLMGNNYHLLIRTPGANLGKVMHHIGGVFTKKYNQLCGRDGPLFRSRYKSILVEAENYLLQVSRYIHLNPVTAGIVKEPEEYLWSSYKYYFNNHNNQSKPDWLYMNETFKYFNQKTSEYHQFISQGVDIETESFFNKTKIFSIRGSEAFINALQFDPQPVNPKEVTDYAICLKKSSPTIENIISVVSRYFSMNPDEISNKMIKPSRFPRAIAIYLASRVTGLQQKIIGDAFNGLTYSTISRLSRQVEHGLIKDKELKEVIKNLRAEIGRMKVPDLEF